MTRKRILALAKLGLLFGTPVAVVLGLFSCGVYVGSTRHTGILSFERDWLGFDVDVPGDDAGDGDDKSDDDDKSKGDKSDDDDKSKGDKSDDDDESKGDKSDDDDKSKSDRSDDDDKPKGDKSDDDAAPAVAPQPSPAAPTPQPAAPATPIIAEDPGPETKVDALTGDLSARHQMAITVRVKVLVDQELINNRADWIDYAQRTVSQASQVYQDQFGIVLELSSVGRWPVATAGMDSGQLLDDLRTRPREESDILVGFTGRPLDEHRSGKADTPAEESTVNGSYALVYGNSRSSRPHLRTLLHELGHNLGAKDIIERTDPAWLGKSWMSYAPAGDDEHAWIDARNRKRVLMRKDLPFAPPPTAEEEQ